MLEVEVIADPSVAVVALDRVRGRLLAELAVPASAASLAERLGIARQKVHYYLRSLEEQKLVSLCEERHWGGLTERIVVASAASYALSSKALGRLAVDPGRASDRLSASYLVALGARIVQEVGELLGRAQAKQKRLATLAVDTELCFRSPTERAVFTHELTQAVNSLVARHHDPSAPNGRTFRLVVVAHPTERKD
jgi:predicted ArsR family transcriptional regulator